VSGVRVIAGVSGSAGSLRALRYAASLVRLRGGVLMPVLAWIPPGGDLADRRCPSSYLRETWRAAAAEQLSEAMELAMGGIPDDILLRPVVVRGEAGRALVATANEATDLLVIGAGRRGVERLATSRVARYCLAHASCPVIAVPPSPLEQASRGIRGWALRHRAAAPDDARQHAGSR
jgi:nucleotide-binding universal stress UspA family protein